MKAQVLCFLSCCALLICGCAGTKPQAANNSRQVNESCDEINKCGEGLFCDYGICRKLCTNKNDCQENEVCERGMCLRKNTPSHETEHTNTDNNEENKGNSTNSATTNNFILTPAAGQASAGGTKVEIVGDTVSGQVSDSSRTTVIINSGHWN